MRKSHWMKTHLWLLLGLLEFREQNRYRQGFIAYQNALKPLTFQAILEMEKAGYILRLQNMPKDKEEDLTEGVTNLLAEALETEKNEIEEETDQIYKLNSSYARRYIVSMLNL